MVFWNYQSTIGLEVTFCEVYFKRMKEHAPHDHLYGPLKIPSYCWPIIDTPEFQRLRYIKQLGPCYLVYPGANHTRFEHSLGCCHLANMFMKTIKENQPELQIQDKEIQAVILTALCHDLGHGPYSHTFYKVCREVDPNWHPDVMSTNILRYIVSTHEIQIDEEVLEATCQFILGYEYQGWPKWLSKVVVNHETTIDLNTFDFLVRDSKRTLNTSMLSFSRLIENCRVIGDDLSYKISEVPTIEALFYTRNDMYMTVYYHRVEQALSLMIQDIFWLIQDDIHLEECLQDPSQFVTLDDRIMFKVEAGYFGEEAQKLAKDITNRNLYKCLDEIHIKPTNDAGERYSQKLPSMIADDISDAGNNTCGSELFRVVSMQYKYGQSPNENPLLLVPFWKKGREGTFKLSPDEISCISPLHFRETAMRIFVTNKASAAVAKSAFMRWKSTSLFN